MVPLRRPSGMTVGAWAHVCGGVGIWFFVDVAFIALHPYLSWFNDNNYHVLGTYNMLEISCYL